MTTNTIIATVRRKALEDGDQLVSDTTILQYANEEYRELRKRLKMNSDVITADVVCANGVCTLPADYGAMYTFASDVDENIYNEVSIADFEVADFDYGFTISEGDLLVSNTDITALTIRYYPEAAVLTTIQNPEVDELFHEVIVYGTLSRVQEDLQDEELANFYRSKADAEFTRKSEIQSSYEEGNQKGGVMFMPQQFL